MNQPLVTVFIPVYNSEKYIGDCLNSIINQTYKNLEILIVDDGSTDNSLDIIESYNDKRIRLIKNDENKGIPYNRNLGLKEACGKYLAVMDSDDIAFPNRIERQVNFMENNLNIDVLGSSYQLMGGRYDKRIISKYKNDQEIKAGLIFLNVFCNSTAFIRLESINKFKIKYNQRYFVAQDYDFFVQVSKFGKLHILPDLLIKYRIGHNNITAKTMKEKSKARQEIINSIHLDILNHYNFQLQEWELKTFNDFFSTNINSIGNNTLKKVPDILEKLVIQNSQINKEVFVKVLKDSTYSVLKSLNINYKEKLSVYKKVCRNESFLINLKNIVYLFMFHIYKKIT